MGEIVISGAVPGIKIQQKKVGCFIWHLDLFNITSNLICNQKCWTANSSFWMNLPHLLKLCRTVCKCYVPQKFRQLWGVWKTKTNACWFQSPTTEPKNWLWEETTNVINQNQHNALRAYFCKNNKFRNNFLDIIIINTSRNGILVPSKGWCSISVFWQIQKQVSQTAGSSFAASLEHLAHRWHLFYRYYFGRCLSEEANWFHFLILVAGLPECFPLIYDPWSKWLWVWN